MLECIEIQTSSIIDASIIWLHGLGADGHDFESIVDELELPHNVGIRFVFPHGPIRPVSINGGMRMRAWYDISTPDLVSVLDLKGIQESVEAVSALLEREISRGVNSKRIILAGFSQGGLIALHLGPRFVKPLAGVLALSTYDPTAVQLVNELSAANSNLAVFMAHGTFDPVVNIEQSKLAEQALKAVGLSVQWCSYPMQHSICAEELRDISTWLSARLEGL